jgi:hypothetical protein
MIVGVAQGGDQHQPRLARGQVALRNRPDARDPPVAADIDLSGAEHGGRGGRKDATDTYRLHDLLSRWTDRQSVYTQAWNRVANLFGNGAYPF